jgi:aminoacylase
METKPLCIVTYRGTDSQLKSIMLSSHMDVVPVHREFWSRDPFAAEIDDEGKIFARGAQDTKGIGTQYLAALRYFVRNKIQFRRTIHVTFTPEEEIGSVNGMREFVHTQEFRDLDVGFELDEGSSLSSEHFVIFYGERATWRVEFTINGTPGHGSLMIENTAAVKLQKLITKFTEYRFAENSRLSHPLDLPMIGRITTSNVTMINGGLQSNVIPAEFKMMVDIRVSNDVDHDEFIKMFEGWCEEAGGEISYRFELHEDKIASTDISDENKYWTTFKSTFDEL